MIKIQIADVVKENSIDEQWVNQQINLRRRDGLSVCVRIIIKEGDLDMVLSTPTCGAGGGGGGRPPRPTEKKVFDLWAQSGLNDEKFSGGNVVAFLKQLRQLT